MRSRSSWLGLFFVPMISAAAGCSRVPVEAPKITYAPSQPFGDWSSYGAAGVENTGGAAGITNHYGTTAGSAAGGSSGRSGGGASSGAAGTGGSEVTGATAGSGGRTIAAGSGGVPAAGSGGSAAGSGGPATTLTTMTFAVTTTPAGYLYQPRNIGAIWVQNSSGKLVKSLEVWASVRKRYLTRYASALNGSPIDVIASATLPYHRTHQVTWNLQDKTGAAVAPGKYTLVMELTDGDQTGPSDTVAFDTSAGPSTISPANAPSFGTMRLQLQ